MTYELQVGDYIKFFEIITPESKTRIRDSTGGNHDFVKQVRAFAPRSGAGQIMSMPKSLTRLDGRKVRTASVDAGQLLGKVTAVIDNAVLVAKQLGFDMDVTGPADSMYSTDAKDHQ